MTLLIDPNDANLKSKVEALQPTTGYCIFVDIVGSTEMKSEDIKKWIALTFNTFANTRSFLSPFAPLKAVGDELMFYVTDEQVSHTGDTALTIFAGLASVARETESDFKNVKIAVAYCRQAYAITFVPKITDFYGKDVDLTARLLAKAGEREVIMNQAFVEKVRECHSATGNKEQFPEVEQIIGPWLERFKGFDDYVPIYKLPDAQHGE